MKVIGKLYIFQTLTKMFNTATTFIFIKLVLKFFKHRWMKRKKPSWQKKL